MVWISIYPLSFSPLQTSFWLCGSILCAGNALLTLKSNDAVKVLTIRGTNFEAAALDGGNAAKENAPSADLSQILAQFVGQELSKSDRPELTSAKIVISGGLFCTH